MNMNILQELYGMQQDFNWYSLILKRKNRFGPVLGYSKEQHFARIDVDFQRTKPWQMWIHIDKEWTQTERCETFEDAYYAMVRSIKRYRLHLLY